MPTLTIPPSVQAVLNTVGGAMGRISYSGWGSFGPGPAALQLGLSVPSVIRFAPYLPEEGWVDAAKVIVADVLSSVGFYDYERGVYDRTQPSVPVVLYPTVEPGRAEIPDPDARPWPGSTSGPGWDDSEWVYPEVEEVAHDWGHLIRQGIETVTGIGTPPIFDPIISQMPVPAPGGGGGVVIGGGGGNALCPPSGSCGGPRYLTYDCKTGQMSVRRRRRRRRLLTDGDKQDLGTIVAMFGKGAAAQIALAAAVKR